MKRKFLRSLIAISLVATVFVCSMMALSFNASAGATEMELMQIAVSHLKEQIDELEANSVTNETLDAELASLKQELQGIIDGVEAKLDTAIASLEEADKENTAELQEAIVALGKALAEAKAVSESGVTSLDAKIAETNKLLTEKLGELQKALEDTKESLEAKDSELESRADALESKMSELEDKVADLDEKSEELENIEAGCESAVALSALAVVGILGASIAFKKKEK